MKEKIAAFGLAALLVVVFLGLRRGGVATVSTPEEAVRRMFEFGSKGDVGGYIGCFDEDLAARLKADAERMGRAKFGAYLKKRNSPVKGMAFSDVRKTRDDEVRMKVEWVFLDRNEVQLFTLRRVRGKWKIKDMSDPKYVKPLVPYGTKVFEE